MIFDWSVVWSSLPLLLGGAWMTIWLTFVTMTLAIPGGLLLALMRLSPLRPVSGLATAFVEFFRATPLILQIYWVYYVLPAYFDVQLSQLATAILGLTCNISALPSLSLRHRLDPPGDLGTRPGTRDAQGECSPASSSAAIMRVCRRSPHLGRCSRHSLVLSSQCRAFYVALQLRTTRNLEVLTAMAALLADGLSEAKPLTGSTAATR
jgi:polar amino acid transport system permease protein